MQPPGNEQRQLEDAAWPADLPQRHQHNRPRRSFPQARTKAQVSRRRIVDDGDLLGERGLSDQPFPQLEPWNGALRWTGVPVLTQQAEAALAVQVVERAGRRIQMTGQEPNRAGGQLSRFELASHLLPQSDDRVAHPVVLVALPPELLEALRHLVRLPGQVQVVVRGASGEEIGVRLDEAVEIDVLAVRLFS